MDRGDSPSPRWGRAIVRSCLCRFKVPEKTDISLIYRKDIALVSWNQSNFWDVLRKPVERKRPN